MDHSNGALLLHKEQTKRKQKQKAKKQWYANIVRKNIKDSNQTANTRTKNVKLIIHDITKIRKI